MLDPYLMGYKDRERYLDPRFKDFVFDRSGNVTNTIVETQNPIKTIKQTTYVEKPEPTPGPTPTPVKLGSRTYGDMYFDEPE